MIYVYQKKT